MKSKICKIIIESALKLHTFSYRLSSFFSNKIDQGLHPKHRLMNYHKFFTDNIDSRDTVLDIGCGNGALTFDIAKKAKKVIGIDLNEENIIFAKKMFSRKNIEYVQGDILENFSGKRFDVIVLSNVLEHIENRLGFLRKIKRQGSKFLIRVPMLNRDWITLYKKELGLEWKLDRGHFTEYTLESFQKELQKAGLKIYNYSIQFGEIWSVVIKS